MDEQAAGRIRVGMIGAGPTGSWAAAAHLPALARLDGFAVTAVATTREATAREAAAAFGAAHAFTDAAALAGCAEVDLVVVSVKAPGHAEAVSAALAAGKHVLCEWPLGVDAGEAARLAGDAAAAGVVTAIGLQGYHSPSVRYVRDLIAEGRIGRVEAVAAVIPGDPLGGGAIPASLAWGTDPGKGNTLLSIMGGHALAVLEHMAGRLTEVSAVLANLHERVLVTETGESVANSAPGQLALAGRTADGAVVSVSVQGGSSTAGPDAFFIRVSGTEGALIITPDKPGTYPHWTDLSILLTRPDGTRTSLAVPERYRLVPGDLPPGPAVHVAALYREVGQAIAEGRPAHPDFAAALRHHRLLAAIEQACATGTRRIVEDEEPRGERS